MIKIEASIDLGTAARIMIQVSNKVKANLERAVRYSAMEIYNASRAKCPVITGNLRDSISIKYLNEYPNFAAFIGTNVEYAQAQEFNEWYEHHHPDQKNANAQFGFFRKSLAEVEPAFRERVSNILGGVQ